jgi:hypothetical protein
MNDMGKPTAEELQVAIAKAITMREGGHDEDNVAKALLSLNYRMQKMEALLSTVKRYLHAGQSATDHRNLLLAVQVAEKANADEDKGDSSSSDSRGLS